MKHDTLEMTLGMRVVELVWFALVGSALLMGLMPWLLDTSGTLSALCAALLCVSFWVLVMCASLILIAEFMRVRLTR